VGAMVEMAQDQLLRIEEQDLQEENIGEGEEVQYQQEGEQ
jgi:hypothetical protein